jgi:hypothetical protein
VHANALLSSSPCTHIHQLIQSFTLLFRFPIHCAVMGGSLELVKWLVETHLCPWAGQRDPITHRLSSVQTSACRTLLDLTMTGRPKLQILTYFVQKGLSVEDVKDKTLIPKTLQILLMNDALASSSKVKTDVTSVSSGHDGAIRRLYSRSCLSLGHVSSYACYRTFPRFM